MTTRSWNTSYEQSPPDGQDINQGATRIRELKIDVRERLAVDHLVADGETTNSTDGRHQKSTYLKQGSDPSVPTDYGVVYVKDHNNGSNTKPELHYRNVDGTVMRLSERGSWPLFNTRNAWNKGQYTPQYDLGTGSGNIAIDASLSNGFVRVLSGNSTLVLPTNGANGTVIYLHVYNPSNHTLTVRGQGWYGSGDLDYDTAFNGSTFFVLGYISNNWRILNILRALDTGIT